MQGMREKEGWGGGQFPQGIIQSEARERETGHEEHEERGGRRATLDVSMEYGSGGRCIKGRRRIGGGGEREIA